MKYLSVDIETTGLDPSKNGIVEIGCVLADTTHPGWNHTYHKVVNPGITVEWDDYAKDLHKDWWKPNVGMCPQALLWNLAEWLKVRGVDPLKIWAAGKNFGSFDQRFLREIPGYGEAIKFKSRSLDPAILFFDPYKDEEIPDLETCRKRAGLPNQTTHRALDDAVMVVALLNIGFGRRTP